MTGFLDIAIPAVGLAQSGLSFLAGREQSRAADRATRTQERQFAQTREDLAPFREAGVNALNQLTAALGPNFQASDAFRFNLGEGLRAIDQIAASRGKALSGEAVRGAQRFATGLASNEINNYLNRLAALAGIGQTATTNTGSFGAGAANQIGQGLIDAGTARASGFVGAGNAASDTLNNLILLNALR